MLQIRSRNSCDTLSGSKKKNVEKFSSELDFEDVWTFELSKLSKVISCSLSKIDSFFKNLSCGKS